MKSLLLLLAAAALSFGFEACANHSSGQQAKPKPVPPGSGGRGDTPGIHAESQNPR
jgi:hypothetical protein